VAIVAAREPVSRERPPCRPTGSKPRSYPAIESNHDKLLRQQGSLQEVRLSREFIDEVARVLGIEALSKTDRFGASYIVHRWLTDNQRHVNDSDAVAVSRVAIEWFFGERRFKRLAHLFDHAPIWSSKKGIARPIKPSANYQEALRNMTPSPDRGTILKFDGNRVSQARLPRSVAIVKNRRTANLAIEPCIQIDLERLRAGEAALTKWIRHVNSGLRGERPAIYRGELEADLRNVLEHNGSRAEYDAIVADAVGMLTRRRQQMRQLRKAADQDGMVRQRYREVETGRWFALGTNVQNTPRLVLATALYGCTAYDIDACHFTLLEQIAERGNVPRDRLTDYVQNKTARRLELAEYMGVSEKVAKSLYARLPCGGGISEDPDCDLHKVLDKTGIRLLSAHDGYMDLRDQVKAATKFMRSPGYTRRVPRNALVVNAKGQRYPEGADNPQLDAFILQGLEAAALEAALHAHTDGQQLPLAALHDGWITREHQPPEDAEAAIRAGTVDAFGVGYTVTVRDKRLSVSGLTSGPSPCPFSAADSGVFGVFP